MRNPASHTKSQRRHARLQLVTDAPFGAQQSLFGRFVLSSPVLGMLLAGAPWQRLGSAAVVHEQRITDSSTEERLRKENAALRAAVETATALVRE